MDRRPEPPLQLQPLLTRVPLRRLHIHSTHVIKAISFISRFAIVRGFDEGFDTEGISDGDAPLDKEGGAAEAAVGRVRVEHCQYYISHLPKQIGSIESVFQEK